MRGIVCDEIFSSHDRTDHSPTAFRALGKLTLAMGNAYLSEMVEELLELLLSGLVTKPRPAGSWGARCSVMLSADTTKNYC